MQVTNPSPLSVGVNQEWGKKNLAVTSNPLRIPYENKAQVNSSSITITKGSAQSLGKDDEIMNILIRFSGITGVKTVFITFLISFLSAPLDLK